MYVNVIQEISRFTLPDNGDLTEEKRARERPGAP